jgi:hypothetical protein
MSKQNGSTATISAQSSSLNIDTHSSLSFEADLDRAVVLLYEEAHFCSLLANIEIWILHVALLIRINMTRLVYQLFSFIYYLDLTLSRITFISFLTIRAALGRPKALHDCERAVAFPKDEKERSQKII